MVQGMGLFLVWNFLVLAWRWGAGWHALQYYPQGMVFILGPLCGTAGTRACPCTMLYGIPCYNIAQYDVAWHIVVFLFYCIRTLQVWVCHLYTALKAHYYTFGRTVGGVLSGTYPLFFNCQY
jgi:hypothetical protein